MARFDSKGEPFPELQNDCIIRAARGEETEYVPVWIMRQAGRYLPEFRDVRKAHQFFEVCETPEIACEVTLQPLRRYDLDAAIIFSDILVIPKALGYTAEFKTGGGVNIEKNLTFDKPIVDQLNVEGVIGRLQHVFDAITLTRHELKGKVPLIGFAGAPYTLVAYMLNASKDIGLIRHWVYNNLPRLLEILDLISDVLVDYLVGQVKAGAQLLQIFESNGEQLTPDFFKDYIYPRLERICKQVKERLRQAGIEPVPIMVFVRCANYSIKHLDSPDNDIDVIGIDWSTEPEFARSQSSKTLQGNLDPWAMTGSAEQLKAMTEKMVKSFGTRKYIANLGHGITPNGKPENVKIFVDTVHSLSRELNQK